VIASPRELSKPAAFGVPRIAWLQLTLPGIWLVARCAFMSPNPLSVPARRRPASRARPSAAISRRFPSRDEVNLDAAHRGPRPILGRPARPGPAGDDALLMHLAHEATSVLLEGRVEVPPPTMPYRLNPAWPAWPARS
jgi:hypothetical protein